MSTSPRSSNRPEPRRDSPFPKSTDFPLRDYQRKAAEALSEALAAEDFARGASNPPRQTQPPNS